MFAHLSLARPGAGRPRTRRDARGQDLLLAGTCGRGGSSLDRLTTEDTAHAQVLAVVVRPRSTPSTAATATSSSAGSARSSSGVATRQDKRSISDAEADQRG
ncbi:hypothetical protein TOK_0250 [Pseudonocardia sp. N23]|nr:hypothetical protein TOK_0250 [Pseudonocardia sp. N23]